MTTAGVDTRIKVEQPSSSRLDELKVKEWPIWNKEPSTFNWSYDSAETCYFLEGEVVVKTNLGETALAKGDLVTFPKGLSCTWNIKKAVKKHYSFSDGDD